MAKFASGATRTVDPLYESWFGAGRGFGFVSNSLRRSCPCIDLFQLEEAATASINAKSTTRRSLPDNCIAVAGAIFLTREQASVWNGCGQTREG